MFEGHCEHLQILKNGGLTDILYMPYLYKSIVNARTSTRMALKTLWNILIGTLSSCPLEGQSSALMAVVRYGPNQVSSFSSSSRREG